MGVTGEVVTATTLPTHEPRIVGGEIEAAQGGPSSLESGKSTTDDGPKEDGTSVMGSRGALASLEVRNGQNQPPGGLLKVRGTTGDEERSGKIWGSRREDPIDTSRYIHT